MEKEYRGKVFFLFFFFFYFVNTISSGEKIRGTRSRIKIDL